MILQCSPFDKAVLIALLSIPFILLAIHVLGFYCNSSDLKNDCPAYFLGYTGTPFWSITAFTSNFIHDVGWNHILSNIGVFYLALLLAYGFLLYFMRQDILNKTFPFSLGLLLTLIVSLTIVPFVSMNYFSHTSSFGKPTFGFSGVSDAFIGFAIYSALILHLLSVSKIKNKAMKLIIPAIVIFAAIFLINHSIDILKTGEGNIIIHLIGFFSGVLVGTFTYLMYLYKKKKTK